jgi:hypothetical protein
MVNSQFDQSKCESPETQRSDSSSLGWAREQCDAPFRIETSFSIVALLAPWIDFYKLKSYFLKLLSLKKIIESGFSQLSKL